MNNIKYSENNYRNVETSLSVLDNLLIGKKSRNINLSFICAPKLNITLVILSTKRK